MKKTSNKHSEVYPVPGPAPRMHGEELEKNREMNFTEAHVAQLAQLGYQFLSNTMDEAEIEAFLSYEKTRFDIFVQQVGS
ncbi:MAG: hypothetical protein AAGI38_05140 [Bacteroidota bacterium]